MGYMDKTAKVREFDPLHIPKISGTTCVLHISSFLEGSGKNNPLREFNVLKKQIDMLSSQKISDINGFRLDLVISINGHVNVKEYISYLKSIDKTVVGNNVNITIFQRPNFGYQWGGFYDVWNRYKMINCDWFVTLEADVYFNDNTWFDYCMNRIANKKEIGFLGMISRKFNTINPKEYGEVVPIPERVWRDKNNNTLKNPNESVTRHTRGGMYFCKRSLLQKLDNVYGCFTHSMGCNHHLDGIILGEVGFSHKTTALGYVLNMNENITGLIE